MAEEYFHISKPAAGDAASAAAAAATDSSTTDAATAAPAKDGAAAPVATNKDAAPIEGAASAAAAAQTAAATDNDADSGDGDGSDAASGQDLWAAFEEAGSDAVEAPDTVVAYLSTELGIEEGDWNKVVESIRDLKTKSGTSAPVYANEAIEQMNKVAAAGGDWRAIPDTAGRIASANSNLQAYEKFTPEEFFRFQLQDQATKLGLPPADFIERNIQGLDPAVVASKGLEIKNQYVNAQKAAITEMQASLADSEKNALAVRKQFADAVDKVIPSFKDRHTKRAIPLREQSAIRKILTDNPSNKAVPQAVYDLIFPTKDGAIDIEASVDRIYNILAIDKKVEHLQKVVRSDTRKGEFAKASGASGDSTLKGGDGKPAAPGKMSIHEAVQKARLSS